MIFGDAERAQSTIVGAILLFAILVIAFSSYQAFVVPNQNAEIEFTHNLEVQNDMQDLRNSLLGVQSVEYIDGNYVIVSEHRPARIRLGTQFPARLIALNPPNPSGTLETTEPAAPLRIENATVSGGNFASNPDVLLNNDLNTTFISYRPNYNEYRDPPETVLEHSLLYNDFPNAAVTVRQQTMIRPQSNRLDIVLFEGDVSQSGSRAVTLDPETLDGPTAPIPIESSGGNITIQIPTRSPAVWNETITELDGVSFETPPNPDENLVRVTLHADQYDLRVTRVGFDGGEKTNELTPIQPADGGGGGAGNYSTVYDTSWDTGSMATQDNISWNGDSLIVDKGNLTTGPIDGFVNVVDAENSDPIVQANVSFRSNNVSILDPDGNAVTDGSGTATSSIRTGVGNARLFTSSGDDADRISVEVRAKINGTVTDSGGNPIEGATVEIGSIGKSDVTDGQGNYVSRGIPSGNYNLSVRADRYASESRTVDVSYTTAGADGVVANEDLTLVREAPGFTSIDVTSAGQGNSNDQLTFVYNTTADTTAVTLFAQTSPGGTTLVDDNTVPTDSTGETYNFNSVQTNLQDIVIDMTAQDTNGNPQTCNGTITNQGGSISLADMTCN